MAVYTGLETAAEPVWKGEGEISDGATDIAPFEAELALGLGVAVLLELPS